MILAFVVLITKIRTKDHIHKLVDHKIQRNRRKKKSIFSKKTKTSEVGNFQIRLLALTLLSNLKSGAVRCCDFVNNKLDNTENNLNCYLFKNKLNSSLNNSKLSRVIFNSDTFA